MTERRLVTFCLAALALAGGAAAEPKAAADTNASARAQVEAALQVYARLVKTADPAALAAQFAPDGELLEPGMGPLQGPAAIRAFLQSFGDVHVESTSMVSDSTQVWGRDALQWGSFEQRARIPKQPPSVSRGRFVAQWARQPNGRWLLRRLLMQPAQR